MQIEINWDIQSTLNDVQSKIEDNGWEFHWDTHSWTFEVSWVSWQYVIDWNICDIDILDKPWLVTESYIEDELREFFN